MVLVAVAGAPIGWGAIGFCVVMAAVSAYCGMRVWQGKPINPQNSLGSEDKMMVLSVTAIPSSLVFLAWAMIGLATQAQSTIHFHDASAILTGFEIVAGVFSLVCFGIGLSLFFTFKPVRFIPPHLRDRVR